MAMLLSHYERSLLRRLLDRILYNEPVDLNEYKPEIEMALKKALQ